MIEQQDYSFGDIHSISMQVDPFTIRLLIAVKSDAASAVTALPSAKRRFL